MQYTVAKQGHSWRVEGDDDGWLFKRTYPTLWKANLAIEVFKKGGKPSDYFQLARQSRYKSTKALKSVNLPSKNPAELNRKRKASKIRRRISQDPNDAGAYLELAEQLILNSPGLTSYSSQASSDWERLPYSRNLTPKLSKAKDSLTTSLALGLTSEFDSAKARYFLISILISELAEGRRVSADTISKNPRLVSLASVAIKELTRHLSRDPHDLQAWRMRIAFHDLLQDSAGVGRAEQAIAETQSLLDAGLINRQKRPSRRSTSHTSAKNKGVAFESRVERALKSLDLKTINQKASADGGIDILAYSEAPIFAGKYIIQCKDWAKPVGEPVIRDLYGVVLAEGANKGILVTTGSFTKSAARFASGKPLELIDGERLRALERG